MNKVIIVVFLVFAIVASIAVYAYFSYEKPAQQETLQYANLTLQAFDNERGKIISTGYMVLMDGASQPFAAGKTLIDGRVLVELPLNHSYKILNNNLDGQHYYTSNRSFAPTTIEPIKLDLSVVPEGNLTMSYDGNLITDDTLYIYPNATGAVHDLHFCVRWTINIISVKNDNYSETAVPARLENKVDKCYDTKTDLQNSFLNTSLQVQKFGNLNENDFINVTFIDGDIRSYSLDKPLIEETNGTDVGIPDISFVIAVNNNV